MRDVVSHVDLFMSSSRAGLPESEAAPPGTTEGTRPLVLACEASDWDWDVIEQVRRGMP